MKIIVLFRLMNNEVMSNMNMNGNGEKIAFRKTTVCEIVIGKDSVVSTKANLYCIAHQ